MSDKIVGLDAAGGKGRAHATIAELYPAVGKIVLFVAFERADSEAEPNYQQIIFSAHTEAAFRLDCSRDDCVGGGFDFAPVIDDLVKSGESRLHDKLMCAGTLGPGGPVCSLLAEYRIIVDWQP